MFKTFTKIALILLALSFMLLSGCSGDYRVSGGPALTDEVSHNGGMVVKKGDFIYFINGISSTSADNTFGNPVKGSIIRMDINTMAKEIIVPKVVLSSYNEGGFYIFGNKIYYTSPSMEKDKNGKRLSGYLDYFSANLDGSGSKKIMTTVSNSNPYKFFDDASGKVFIVYIETSTKKVILVDTESNSKSSILENYTNTPVFAADGYIYYNEAVFKKDDQKETFTYNQLKRMTNSGAEKDEIKLLDNTTLTKNLFTVTLSQVKLFNNKTTIFYTKQSATDVLDPQTLTKPYSYSYTLGEAAEKLLIASADTFDFTNRFYDSATSFLGAYNSNLYYVTYTQQNQGIPDYVLLMPNPSKILMTEGDFVYYINADNMLYKKQYKGDGVKQATQGDKIIDEVTFSTGGLNTKYIDGYLYFIRTNGDYINYLYRINLTQEDAVVQLVSRIAAEDIIEEENDD